MLQVNLIIIVKKKIMFFFPLRKKNGVKVKVQYFFKDYSYQYKLKCIS